MIRRKRGKGKGSTARTIRKEEEKRTESEPMRNLVEIAEDEVPERI